MVCPPRTVTTPSPLIETSLLAPSRHSDQTQWSQTSGSSQLDQTSDLQTKIPNVLGHSKRPHPRSSRLSSALAMLSRKNLMALSVAMIVAMGEDSTHQLVSHWVCCGSRWRHVGSHVPQVLCELIVLCESVLKKKLVMSNTWKSSPLSSSTFKKF